MPPVRRYLRITRHSVLECRIYMDNPADTDRWLLTPSSPALPRVIDAVRPLVLPKLREENAAARAKKGGKRKGWKDEVVGEDFRVAVFLTETSSRHSILRKEKRAKVEKGGRGGRPGGEVTGTREAPVEVGEGVLREEDGGAGAERVQMGEIPSSAADRAGAKLAMEESQDGLFVSEGSEDGDVRMEKSGRAGAEEGSEGEEDKKKLALDTTYDGFSIYGRILCLVVKRRGTAKGKELAGGSGQAMMEEWIASTQMGEAQMMDE